MPTNLSISTVFIQLDSNFGDRYDVPPREQQRRNSSRIEPLHTPAMLGCAFSMDRKFFYELGSYDEGMDIYGAENVEISVRVSVILWYFCFAKRHLMM